jgi:DNA-binding response OmpR family regulator
VIYCSTDRDKKYKTSLKRGGIEMRKKKVLLVDDSKTMREFLKGFLENFEFEVIACVDGGSAIQYLNNADVLITDLEMPRMDGAELTKIAKCQKSNMPVLIITGNPNGVPIDHLADEVIEKPFDMNSILNWLREVAAVDVRRAVSEGRIEIE